MRKISFLTLLLFFTFFVWSQEEKIDLDSVVIQGRFYPMTMNKVDENYTIITPKDIQNSPAQSVEELLSYYAGVDIRRRGIGGMQSDISMRGGTYEQVLSLINGVRVNDAQTAHNMLQLPFDLQAVERIEIIKGPAARKYGANAFSGVVNVITKIKNSNSIQLRGMGASYGTYEAGITTNVGKSRWKNSINVSHASSDGYRHNTDYKKSNAFYQSTYPISQGEIKIQAGFGEKKFGANGFYATASATEQYEEIQISVVSIDVTKKVKNTGLKALAYWKRAQDMYLFVRNNPSIYRNMHIGNQVGAEFSVSIKTNLGVTGIGTELRSENLKSNNLGKRNRTISSVFVEHNFSILQNKLNVTPGFNASHFSESGSFFYPGIELGYNLNQQNKLYASAARVHRVPSYTELFYVSGTEEGNPELKPETADTYEIGYRFLQPTFTTKLSLFYRDSDDLIDWAKNTEEDKWKTQNIAHVTAKGAEVYVKKEFQGFVKAVTLDYTFLENKVNDQLTEFSRYAIQNLKHQMVITMENKLHDKWSILLAFRYLDRVNLDDYSLMDFKLNYTEKNWQAFAAFNNVFDTEYTETNLVPMPGFWISLGAKYTFQLK